MSTWRCSFSPPTRTASRARADRRATGCPGSSSSCRHARAADRSLAPAVMQADARRRQPVPVLAVILAVFGALFFLLPLLGLLWRAPWSSIAAELESAEV